MKVKGVRILTMVIQHYTSVLIKPTWWVWKYISFKCSKSWKVLMTNKVT